MTDLRRFRLIRTSRLTAGVLSLALARPVLDPTVFPADTTGFALWASAWTVFLLATSWALIGHVLTRKEPS